jgi:hypothetical protein
VAQRKNFGSIGRKMPVLANHFVLDYPRDMVVRMYAVLPPQRHYKQMRKLETDSDWDGIHPWKTSKRFSRF